MCSQPYASVFEGNGLFSSDMKTRKILSPHKRRLLLNFSKFSKILFKNLECYGFRGHVLNWIRSYLNVRFQYVEKSGIKLPISRVDQRVPQGSILRPLLFILYINNMNQSSNLKMVHYADYCTAYDIGTDISIPTNKMNYE